VSGAVSGAVIGGVVGAATLECRNCLKEIPAGNMALHEVHCPRINHRCLSCGLVMPVGEREEHELQYDDPAPTQSLFAAVEAADFETLEAHWAHGTPVGYRDAASGDSCLHVAVRKLCVCRFIVPTIRDSSGSTEVPRLPLET